MNYCSQCGAGVSLSIPEGDHLPRHICDQCGEIHYQNPKVVVGCIPEYGQQLLFCKRAIAPRLGYWTLPAGFMENGETAAAGALRETLEEAGAEVEIMDLFTLFNLPHINQIYLLYRARLHEPVFAAGIESLEVKLLEEEQVPWDEIAFPVITESLKLYFADRRAGQFGFHSGDMIRLPGDSPRFEVNMLNAAG
ncbi:NUDIX hydrolase [Sulfuriflexus sp.]|uniref:NUDIX hydrolase n=1 Tax=Sulfuriflexus sp. TaxID=2015443 RepID=UPI0028CEE33A|nr:NUDIX hydrolase [Sulfuriflexus sp.]MDT8403980.1 NUDIX hydrolase [Sulfuriflexus sp.]